MTGYKDSLYGHDVMHDAQSVNSEHDTVLHGGEPDPRSLPVAMNTDPWKDIRLAKLNRKYLMRQRVVSGNPNEPAHAVFDVLRTRLLRTLHENGWNRVAITSPTDGCGKTFVAANLALSLARRESARTVLMDMNLRSPELGDVFGLKPSGPLSEYLFGNITEAEHFLRVGPNLALALNNRAEIDASELLQRPKTKETLEVMQMELDPDVVLYDMPSILKNDDLLSFLPQVDGVLLVVGGGITKAAEIRQVENLLAGQVPLLGVVMNNEEDPLRSFFKK